VTPWLPQANEQNRVVIRASGAAVGEYAKGGFEAVFDGVLGPWWLPTFFEATELVDLHYAILFPSVERCVRNVAARQGHDDEEPATRHMHDQFEQALHRGVIAARHVLIDPLGPEDVAAELLSRYRHGLLAYDGRSN
jgi:hypothetical protein